MKGFPVIISDCNSPAQELLKAALKIDIDDKLLEARVRGVYYLVTFKGQLPRELLPDEIPFLDDAGFLLQHDLYLEQRFSIIIDRAAPRTYNFSLYLSPDGRELYCRLNHGSKISKDIKSIRMFFERIRIQKADMQILIRDEKTEFQRVKAFVENLPDEQPLSKTHEFLLAKSVGGVPCIEPHVEMKVKIKNSYQVVKEKELIAIFYKGQSGEAARDCLGRYIPPQEPIVTDVDPLVIDDSIEAIEENKQIKYYAKNTGYVSLQDNNLSVLQKISLKNVSVTNTGHLLGGLNTPIHITISCTDLLEDSVGEGMVIESGTVEVIGNVGNKVIIKANKVIIKGQTHQGSQIFADEASITIHKGLAVAKQIHVTRLEAGVVKGKQIKIENVYGGKSYGEELKLVTLYSNHRSYCSTSTVINSLKGEDNVLTICASAAPEKYDRYKAFMEGQKQLCHQINDREKQYNIEYAEVRKLQPLIRQFKQELNQKQSSNPAKMKIIREQMLHYKNLVSFIQQLQEEIRVLRQKLQKVEDEISGFEVNIHQAYILSKSGWNGYNKVRYKRLIGDAEDIILAPRINHDGPKVCLNEEHTALISMREKI